MSRRLVDALSAAAAEAAGDDTFGRTEPEPVDVYGPQAEVDWTFEPRSDDLLSSHVRRLLGAPWT